MKRPFIKRNTNFVKNPNTGRMVKVPFGYKVLAAKSIIENGDMYLSFTGEWIVTGDGGREKEIPYPMVYTRKI